MMSINLRLIGAAAALGCVLVIAGCAGEMPQSTRTPGLDTGITSSSGGAMPNSHAPIATTTTKP